MTPIRKKESLQAELTGLEHLYSLTPDDPIAKPLLKSQIDAVKIELNKLEANPLAAPEAEIFFGQGPVIGSLGIEANFAGNVINKFQNMVTNHFAAKFRGVLRRTGRRTGEADSRLFLTALPKGSFGLQLSQPHITDWIIARELTETMEDVTGLVDASAKDDKTFVDAMANFNGRVLIPLTDFLRVLSNAGADCRLVSGRRQTALKKEQVSEAYQRAISAEEKIETIVRAGVFHGALTQSGKFEFTPRGESLMTGWLGEEVTDQQAKEWDRQLTELQCEAEIRLTTISTKTGLKSSANELVNLKPIQQISPPPTSLPPPA